MSIKASPILFTGPMVRALLDGRKTQTRRLRDIASKRYEESTSSVEWQSANELAEARATIARLEEARDREKQMAQQARLSGSEAVERAEAEVKRLREVLQNLAGVIESGRAIEPWMIEITGALKEQQG